MTNKEFINVLSARNSISAKEAQQMVEKLMETIADHLDAGDTVSIQGFGNFDVKKKMERVIVNPGTKQRQLIPPKLAIAFKPSTVLKDKIKK